MNQDNFQLRNTNIIIKDLVLKELNKLEIITFRDIKKTVSSFYFNVYTPRTEMCRWIESLVTIRIEEG